MDYALPPLRSWGVRELGLLGLLAACVEVAARSMGGPGPTSVLLGAPFVHISLAGVYVAFCTAIIDPAQRARARCIGIALMAAAVGAVLLGVRPMPITLVLAAPFGILGIVAFALAVMRNRGAERLRWGARFAEALVIPLLSSIGPFGVWALGNCNPVYDLHFLAFDDTLGFRPSTVMVHLFDAVPLVYGTGVAAYVAITLVTVAVHARTRTTRHPVDLLLAFTLVGAVGVALYAALPGIGPTHTVLDHYEGAMPALGGVVAAPFDALFERPRNAMPSMHTAWALLIWFTARSFPAGLRYALRLFAVLNLLATLGLGEHWLIDLVVAVPMTVAGLAACAVDARAAERRAAVLWGLGMTAAWIVVLRWGIEVLAVPGIAWAAMPATVLWSFWLERRVFIAATASRTIAPDPVPARA